MDTLIYLFAGKSDGYRAKKTAFQAPGRSSAAFARSRFRPITP